VQQEEHVGGVVVEPGEREADGVVHGGEELQPVVRDGQLLGEVAVRDEQRREVGALGLVEPEVGQRRRVEPVGRALAQDRRDPLDDHRLVAGRERQAQVERFGVVEERRPQLVGNPVRHEGRAVELRHDLRGDRLVRDVGEVVGGEGEALVPGRRDPVLHGVEHAAAVRVELQGEVEVDELQRRQRRLVGQHALGVEVAVEAERVEQVGDPLPQPERREDLRVQHERLGPEVVDALAQQRDDRRGDVVEVDVDHEHVGVVGLREDVGEQDLAVAVEVAVEDEVVVQLGRLGVGQAEVGQVGGVEHGRDVADLQLLHAGDERVPVAVEVGGEG
jgi:hypothetical protein